MDTLCSVSWCRLPGLSPTYSTIGSCVELWDNSASLIGLVACFWTVWGNLHRHSKNMQTPHSLIIDWHYCESKNDTCRHTLFPFASSLGNSKALVHTANNIEQSFVMKKEEMISRWILIRQKVSSCSRKLNVIWFQSSFVTGGISNGEAVGSLLCQDLQSWGPT